MFVHEPSRRIGRSSESAMGSTRSTNTWPRSRPFVISCLVDFSITGSEDCRMMACNVWTYKKRLSRIRGRQLKTHAMNQRPEIHRHAKSCYVFGAILSYTGVSNAKTGFWMCERLS